MDPHSRESDSRNRQTSRGRSNQRSTSYSHDHESTLQSHRRRSSSIAQLITEHLYGSSAVPTRSASLRPTRQESTYSTSRRRSSSDHPIFLRSVSIRPTRHGSTHGTPRRRSSSARPSRMHDLFGTSNRSHSTTPHPRREPTHRPSHANHSEHLSARTSEQPQQIQIVGLAEPARALPRSKTKEVRKEYARVWYAKNRERILAERREDTAQNNEAAQRRRQQCAKRNRGYRARDADTTQESIRPQSPRWYQID